MTQTGARSSAPVRRSPRWGLELPLLAALTLVIVSALALTDRARATSPEALRSLGFGRPINWLIQDQTSLDPSSYPRAQAFQSPWEHPAVIDVLPLLLSVAPVLAVLTGLRLASLRLAARS